MQEQYYRPVELDKDNKVRQMYQQWRQWATRDIPVSLNGNRRKTLEKEKTKGFGSMEQIAVFMRRHYLFTTLSFHLAKLFSPDILSCGIPEESESSFANRIRYNLHQQGAFGDIN